MLTLAIVSVLSEYANQAREPDRGRRRAAGHQARSDLRDVRVQHLRQDRLRLCRGRAVRLVSAWRGGIVHSPFGRSLDGIRQNPRRMRAIGTPVWWRLVAIYTISAAMAGSAGALSAHATRFVGLSVLSLLTSGIVTVALILGGTRRLYGAFLGATIYFVVQDYSAKISPFFWEFVVGGMLIAYGAAARRRPVGSRARRPAAARSLARRREGPRNDRAAHRAVGSRPVEEFRRAGRRAGDRSRPRAGRPGGVDRTQWRRQDDIRQSVDRLSRTR